MKSITEIFEGTELDTAKYTDVSTILPLGGENSVKTLVVSGLNYDNSRYVDATHKDTPIYINIVLSSTVEAVLSTEKNDTSRRVSYDEAMELHHNSTNLNMLYKWQELLFQHHFRCNQ